MDFVTHLPRTSWRHDAVWVIVDGAHEVSTFSSYVDDLHIGGVLSVVYPRDL